jgi:stringent starvation protein B
MEVELSTKPYLVRAIHEWCIDNGFSPHLLVVVDGSTRVPLAYVKEGEIVLNLNYTATKDLKIENDAVSFSARFNGVAQSLFIPIASIKGIFARENGEGMFFEVQKIDDTVLADVQDSVVDSEIGKSKKPSLKIVK